MFFAALRERKCENDLIVRHVQIFVMLYTTQIITLFNALWSHKVAHNSDHAIFNVDCC